MGIKFEIENILSMRNMSLRKGQRLQRCISRKPVWPLGKSASCGYSGELLAWVVRVWKREAPASPQCGGSLLLLIYLHPSFSLHQLFWRYIFAMKEISIISSPVMFLIVFLINFSLFLFGLWFYLDASHRRNGEKKITFSTDGKWSEMNSSASGMYQETFYFSSNCFQLHSVCSYLTFLFA